MDITVRTSLRKKKRELFDALGDNILRYIAELVTNADDSYKRLGDSAPENKLILIELKKDPKNKEGGYMLSVTVGGRFRNGVCDHEKAEVNPAGPCAGAVADRAAERGGSDAGTEGGSRRMV